MNSWFIVSSTYICYTYFKKGEENDWTFVCTAIIRFKNDFNLQFTYSRDVAPHPPRFSNLPTSLYVLLTLIDMSYESKEKSPSLVPPRGILSIFLLVVGVEIDIITAKPYIQTWKVYFNEFVQNSLCCNIGMIIFDLHGYGGC